MYDFVVRLFTRLAFWRKSAAQDAEPVAQTTRPRRKRRKAESGNAFAHMTDVLDLLPKCRELIGPLKKVDADAYRFWKQFGAKIVPDTTEIGGDLPELLQMPHIGMIFDYFEGGDDDIFEGRFVYFSRLDKDRYNFAVPPNAAALYQVCVVFTDRRGRPFGYEYAVAVGDNGAISVVSQRQVTPQRLPRGNCFYRIEWGMPAGLTFHFGDIKRRHPKSCTTAQDLGVEMFAVAVQSVFKTSDDFQIRAERDGVSVAFNVALGRTPQFFKDRETDVTTDGRRRRIFHAVKEHKRVGADGKETIVKPHYRGERSFQWKGEAITITPAERSITKTFDLVGKIFRDDQEKPAGWTSSGIAAQKLRNAAEAEWRNRRA